MNTFFNDPPGFVQQPQRGKVGAASLVQVGGGGGDAAGLDWKYACVRASLPACEEGERQAKQGPRRQGEKDATSEAKKMPMEKNLEQAKRSRREGGKQNKRVKDILFQVID